VGRWGGDLRRVVHSVNEGEPPVLTAAGPSIGRKNCLSCWPVPRARGVLPCDIASSARQVLCSTFTAPVGWKSTAFHPEARAVHPAIQRRERRPVVATLGRKIVVGQGVGEAGDGLLGDGNVPLLRGDDLIRQSGDRLRDPPQGQKVPERALEPPSRILHFISNQSPDILFGVTA